VPYLEVLLKISPQLGILLLVGMVYFEEFQLGALNRSPSLLMSNCSEAIPPSWSNTHTLMRDPQRVKPKTK
jgi:hypothetical protein